MSVPLVGAPGSQELLAASKLVQDVEMYFRFINDPQAYTSVTETILAWLQKDFEKRLCDKNAGPYLPYGPGEERSQAWEPPAVKLILGQPKINVDRLSPLLRSLHAKRLPDNSASFLLHAFRDVRSAGIRAPDVVLLKVLAHQRGSAARIVSLRFS